MNLRPLLTCVAFFLAGLPALCPALTLNEALDNDSLTFTTGGDAAWTPRESGGIQGGDMAAVNLPSGKSAWIETKITGPGWLSCNFYCDPVSLSPLSITVDGVAQYWNGVFSQEIAEGVHTVRWTASLYAFYPPIEARLDRVDWRPYVMTPISSVTPPAGMTFTTFSPGPWSHIDWPDYDNGGALRSNVASSYSETWLEAAVAGQVEVEYQVRNTGKLYSNSSMRVSGPGMETDSFYGSPGEDWHRHTAYIPPGNAPSIRWTASGAWLLDGIVVRPAVSLEEALDVPGLTWTTDANLPSYGITRDSHDGVDAARLISPPGRMGFISTTVSGPAMFSIKAKRQGTQRPALELIGTGVAGSWTTLGEDWEIATLPIPSGAHSVRIVSHFDHYVLDEATLTPVPAGTIAEGLHTPGRQWATSAGNPWSYSPVPGPTHPESAGLSLPEGAATGSLETTVEGPGTVYFDWMDDESDTITRFLVDGKLVAHPNEDYASPGIWQPHWYALPAGTHTLRWETQKFSGPAGLAAGMAGFQWTPEIDLPALMESGDRVFSWTRQLDWSAETASTVSGGDALRFTGELETFVVGPGKLSFSWRALSSQLWFSDNSSGSVYAPADAWKEETVNIAPGYHRLRWSNWNEAALLDKVQFVPNQGTTLGAALDATELTWATDPTNPWQAIKDPDSGDDYAVPGYESRPSTLSTTVSGAGWLRYRSTGGGISLDDNGAWRDNPNTSLEEDRSILLPPGTHVLTWRAERPDSNVRLDHVSFTPLPSVSAGSATETGSRIWRTSADAPWVGYGDIPGDVAAGNDALLAGWKKDTISWVETDVTGPGLFDFWIIGPMDSLWSVMLDGKVVPLYGMFWPGIYINDTATHTLRWNFWAEAPPVDLFGLDNASWTKDDRPSLASALDSSLNFTTGGTRPWTGTSLRSFDGRDAAVSAALGKGESAWLQTTVNGPATISFQWYLLHERPDERPRLEFQVDGATITDADESDELNQPNWYKEQVSLPAGSHVLRWVHTGADMYGAADTVRVHPDSAAVVDNITINQGGGFPAALDLPGSLVRATGNVSVKSGAIAHDGVDAVSMALGAGEFLTALSVPLSGPGMLHFWWKASAEGTRPYLHMGTYGMQLYSNGTEWKEVSLPVPVDESGSPVIAFFELSSPGEVLIDEMRVVSSGAAVALREALDTPEIQWTAQNGLWAGTSNAGRNGTDGASCTLVSGIGSAVLQTTLTGGTFSFWAMIEGSGEVQLKIDGHILTGFTLTDEWTRCVITLGTGPHQIEFTHLNHADWTEAHLDECQWTPGPGLTFSEATDAVSSTAISWPDPASTWWQPIGYAGLNASGGHAAAFTSGYYSPNSGRVQKLKATVTGPGYLHFQWRWIGPQQSANFAPRDIVIGIPEPPSLPPALVCTVDQNMIHHLGGNGPQVNTDEWYREFVYIPSGQHEVSWNLQTLTFWFPSLPGVTGLLDAVRFQPLPAAYGEWAAAHITADKLPPSPWYAPSVRQSPQFDADADGIPNVVEFAAGSLPEVIGSQPAFNITRAGGVTRFTMPLSGQPGMILFAEKSGDLAAWTRTGITDVSASTPGAFTVEAPAPADGKLFFRLGADFTP